MTKIVLIAFTVMTLISAPQLVGSNPAETQNSDNAELTRLAIEAGHAYARRDLPALERLIADDYAQSTSAVECWPAGNGWSLLRIARAN